MFERRVAEDGDRWQAVVETLAALGTGQPVDQPPGRSSPTDRLQSDSCDCRHRALAWRHDNETARRSQTD